MTMNGKDWQDLIEQTQRLDGVPVSEWLSAYYDGELSAGERLRVESWLEQHPGARDLLGEFSELSTLVGQAGGLSPRELEDVGQHGLQRRILSRLEMADSPTTRPLHGVGGRAWKRWGIALVSVAASLGLVVLLVPPNRKPNMQVAAGNGAATPETLPEAAELLKADAAGMRSPVAAEIRRTNSANETPAATAPPRRATGFAGTRPMPASAPPAAAMPGEAAPSRRMPLEALAPAPVAAGASPVPYVPVASSMPILAPGTTVDPGEIIHHLATQGDEAVIIEYTVVDVRKTAGELEVLLRKQGIQPVTQASRTAPAKGGESAPMFAIYVEAGDRQLAAALKEFRTVPTSIDLLDPMSDQKKTEEAEAKLMPKAGAGKDEAGSSRPAEKGSEKEPDPARAKTGDGPGQVPLKSIGAPVALEGATKESRDQTAYQMPFPLSREEANQLPRRSQQVKQQQGYGEFAEQRAAEQKRVGGETASRVLIVLQAGPAGAK